MGAHVLDYLEDSARTHPESCAVIDENGCLTYAELREGSRKVGSALAKRDVRARAVIIAMDKGANALMAQLGVLYAGGFYVPVDPLISLERLELITITLGEAPIIVDAAFERRIADRHLGIEPIRFGDLYQSKVNEEKLREVRDRALETDPVYTLFTSGSTGVPKGVIITHRAIMSFIDAFVGVFGINDTDRIGNQAPFDFDVSTKDIYASLAASATLVIIPRKLFMRPADLAKLLEEQRVTVLIWAVAALCLMSTYHAWGVANLSAIRSVLFSGETMPTKHLKSLRSHLPNALFANLYGPTETTCNCLYHILEPNRDYAEGVPLGISFDHCDVVLIDGEGHEVTTAGVEGELLVRGPSLALGYLGQPELTSQAFVQNPLNTRFPDRVYRTGDIAKRDGEGRLFFCGRKDNQVKYQGHRVELEEIDLAFERFSGVDRCRCAFDAEKRLIRAFYEGAAEERELSQMMRRTLPAFMCPASIRRVAHMPLTKNGKVDRSQLLELSR